MIFSFLLSPTDAVTSRNLEIAKKIFVWKILLLVAVVTLLFLHPARVIYIPVALCFSFLSPLFGYILFLGFRDIGIAFRIKYLIPFMLFLFIESSTLSLVGNLIDTFSYQPGIVDSQVTPYSSLLMGISVLLNFLYAYIIGTLPESFGKLPNRARIANIGAALFNLTSLLISYHLNFPQGIQTTLAFIEVVTLIAFIASYYYDYKIISLAIRLIKGEPLPTNNNISPEIRYRGLRGWLLFPFIALSFWVLRFGSTVYQDVTSLNSPGYTTLTDPSSQNFIALFGLFSVLEIVCFSLLFGATLYVLYLYLNRKKQFPLYFVFLSLAVLLVTLMEVIIPTFFRYSSVEIRESLAPTFANLNTALLQQTVYCMIWIPYIFKSKRVKATFIEPVLSREAPTPPEI